jgi:hypothetical protein
VVSIRSADLNPRLKNDEKWRFPKIGVPPNIHFRWRFSMRKNILAGGFKPFFP